MPDNKQLNKLTNWLICDQEARLWQADLRKQEEERREQRVRKAYMKFLRILFSPFCFHASPYHFLSDANLIFQTYYHFLFAASGITETGGGGKAGRAEKTRGKKVTIHYIVIFISTYTD